MSRRYQAVLFDMDGLMLDTERIYMRAQGDAARLLGFEADDELLLSFVGVSGRECMRMMRDAAGDAFPMDKYQTLWYTRWRQYVIQDGIPLKDGLTPMLAWLGDNEVPRAVVTSTHTADAETCLQRAGVRSHFNHVIAGDQVAHSKPAPDIYLEGARRLGIEAERCVALEDSNAGALSAAAAGMRVIMVPDLRQPSDEARGAAHAILPSLVDALPLIQAWLQGSN